jgi:hypothetical protein
MKYDEIYKKEIFKNNMQMNKPKYENTEQQILFEKIEQLGAEKKKAASALVEARSAAKAVKPSQATTEAVKVASESEKITATAFEKYLTEWKNKYPDPIFDSNIDIDINNIKTKIDENTAIVQYIPLDNFLQILVITKEDINLIKVNVTYKQLNELILQELISKNIEQYGHRERYKINYKEKDYKKNIDLVLEKISNYLYYPITDYINNKKYIYFVTSKSISYVPFAALIARREDNDDKTPVYLIQDKIITLSRFSYFDINKNTKKTTNDNKLIIVSDPRHKFLNQSKLKGAAKEGTYLDNLWETRKLGKHILLQYEGAKESTWLDYMKKDKYNIFYFATHGIPHSETL